MKGKRYTTEDKIRILREADRGEKSIADICRDENLSAVSFHRWKKQFGQMDTGSRRAAPSLRRGLTTDRQKHKLNHFPGPNSWTGPEK
jgi:transposase-like protein